MKKIMMSLLLVAIVATAASVATVSYFSDTETSENNTFAAGTLDLRVDNQDDPNVVHVTLNDMKPGDAASYNWTLSNAGSLAGKPWIEITNVVNNDNGCNDSETDAPDTTCTATGGGELGDYLLMKVNAPGNVGYVYPNAGAPSCIAGNECTLNYWSSLGRIDQIIDGQVWDTIAASSTLGGPMVLEFQIQSSTGNIIQSDSVSFDVVFHLDQVTP